MPVGIEPHHDAVVIDANDRIVGSVAIAEGACFDNDVAVDGNRCDCAAYELGASRVEALSRIGLA